MTSRVILEAARREYDATTSTNMQQSRDVPTNQIVHEIVNWLKFRL